MIDRYPLLIARCTCAEDVITSVNFARTHQLLVAVRGGGHQVAGHATCDNGLVIDLSPMKEIEIDPEARTARVGPGNTWGDLDRATQTYGLATPGGAVSDTGIAGLTLGGGFGWLRNKYGLACDNLLSVEIVTAGGRHLRASETENPELFWGIRGGGGNFGVVTSFEYKLYQVGPEMIFCFAFHHGEKATEALRFFRDYTATAPDEVGVLAVLGVFPPGAEAFPHEVHGLPYVLFASTYVGSPQEGERRLQPLREFSTPLVDFSGRMSYVQMQTVFDEDYPNGLRYYWKSTNLLELSDEAIGVIVEQAQRQPSPLSTTDIWHNAGAIARMDPNKSAFRGRDVPYLVSAEANWVEPGDDEANISWVRGFLKTLQPLAEGGSYLNFAGFQEEGDELMKAAFAEQYQRLVELKKQYDPTNLFRLNQNIRSDP
ncbi:MAG: FAD-binding oxidoreductase [Caldilineaceae bacterium]|nr:FAD-binding oxidoreductase [Caldilineaceae bacterium]